MTPVPQYSMAVSRSERSKPFGDDLVGQIGKSVCDLIKPPMKGFLLGSQIEPTQRELVEEVSRRIYDFVAEVGEEKARLAFAEYGLLLRVDDEGRHE